MAKFFFHVTHDGPRIDDVTGVELADRKAAFDEATRTCGEMMKDLDGQMVMGTDWKMVVTDETGPVYEISFGAKRLCRQ